MLERSAKILGACRASLRAAVGLDELYLFTGLALATAGLWMLVGGASLMLPGGALIWISLPSRSSFIEKSPGSPEKKTERTR